MFEKKNKSLWNFCIKIMKPFLYLEDDPKLISQEQFKNTTTKLFKILRKFFQSKWHDPDIKHKIVKYYEILFFVFLLILASLTKLQSAIATSRESYLYYVINGKNEIPVNFMAIRYCLLDKFLDYYKVVCFLELVHCLLQTNFKLKIFPDLI